MTRKRRVVSTLPKPDDGQHYDTTDPGNALRFIAKQGSGLRYVDELGWFAWDGKRFRHDPSGVRVRRLALSHAIGEYNSILAQTEGEHKHADPEVKKFRGNKMMHRIRAMLDAARSSPRIHAQASDFDRDPDLINLLNGTLNLRTGRHAESPNRRPARSRSQALDHQARRRGVSRRCEVPPMA